MQGFSLMFAPIVRTCAGVDDCRRGRQRHARLSLNLRQVSQNRNTSEAAGDDPSAGKSNKTKIINGCRDLQRNCTTPFSCQENVAPSERLPDGWKNMVSAVGGSPAADERNA